MRNIVKFKIRSHYYHRQSASSLKTKGGEGGMKRGEKEREAEKKKKSWHYKAICSYPKLFTWLFALLVRKAFVYSHHGVRVRLPTWC